MKRATTRTNRSELRFRPERPTSCGMLSRRALELCLIALGTLHKLQTMRGDGKTKRHGGVFFPGKAELVSFLQHQTYGPRCFGSPRSMTERWLNAFLQRWTMKMSVMKKIVRP